MFERPTAAPTSSARGVSALFCSSTALPGSVVAFVAVLSLLFEMAEKEPVVLVIEDLHWADPSTVELLGQLAGEVGSARVLALFTARPELTPPWTGAAAVHLIQLGRLERSEAEQMVLRVTSGRALPAEVL